VLRELQDTKLRQLDRSSQCLSTKSAQIFLGYKTVLCLWLMLIHFKQAEGSNFAEERKETQK